MLSDSPARWIYGAMPGVTVSCSENAWIEKNKNSYQWYYDNYPGLVMRGVSLPASFSKLKAFYIIDMADRNLTPLTEYLSCYEFLFSYLLGRIDGTIVFQGRSWWQLTYENFPGAVSKTFEDILNPFGIPLYVWAFGGVIVYMALK